MQQSIQHQRAMRRATYAAVSVALLLIVLKLGGYLLTESVALLSSLVDSSLDALASLVNLFAVRQSLVPADQDHRFGHGKAEALAGLAQGAFITGSALLLFVEAGQRLYAPGPLPHSAVGIAIMVASMAFTSALVLYQRHVVRLTGSLAIQADSVHYFSDFLINIGVIAALMLGGFGLLWADPVIGLAIAVMIMYSAWQIAKQSLDQLMDRELPDGERRRIEEIVRSHVEVSDLHDLRTRMSGQTRFIQLHLEMPGELTLMRAHRIAEEVQHELEAAFPDSEVIIHEDPAGITE
jgi:ferrous-iron efflux pump FieF